MTIQADKAERHGGGQAAHISSNGPIACLVSRSFEPPTTGRVSMSVWLYVADVGRQPPLRPVALEGKLDGRDYYRFAPWATQALGTSAVPLRSQWAQYVFQVDDLPLQGLSQLHVRFDLMGQGDVWIDDVQLFDLAFNETELRHLGRAHFALADVTLKNGQVGDCMKLLDSYWPRFLVQHVPLAPMQSPRSPREVRRRPTNHRAPQTGLMDRMKNLLPGREKLRS